MNSLTVRQRIILSFLAVLLLMGGMAVIAHQRLADIQEEARHVEADSLPGLYYSGRIISEWNTGFSLAQQHALHTDRSARERIAARLEASRAAMLDSARKYEPTITA